MSTENAPGIPRSNASGRIALIIVLALAAFLRIWNFPASQEIRDWDEMGYVCNGLMAWEGLTPGWRSTPAGPQTWTGWLYAAGESGLETLRARGDKSVPGMLKPYLAIDQALFKAYEDIGPLRRLMLVISLAVAIIAIYFGYRLGAKYGGPAGGLLVGGLVAVLPLYIDLCGNAKSASDSWMFSIMAVSCAATLTGQRRCWWAGIFLGLAIASRIDMVLVLPPVLWALWDTSPGGIPWKNLLLTMAVTAAAGIIAAPFAVEGFVGLTRNAATSRAIGYWPVASPRLETLKNLAWNQGLGPLLLATIIGLLFFPSGTRRRRAVLRGLCGVDGVHDVRQSLHGHALSRRPDHRLVDLRGDRRRRAAPTSATVHYLSPSAPCCWRFHSCKRSIRSSPPRPFMCRKPPRNGSMSMFRPERRCICIPDLFRMRVLPTADSANAIWDLLSENHAWETRMKEGFDRFSLPKEFLPRALSEDNLEADRGLARRWFILGGGHSSRPRFDVRLISLSATFGLQRSNTGAAFQKTGGVVVWRTAASGMPPGLGEPYLQMDEQQRRRHLDFCLARHPREIEEMKPISLTIVMPCLNEADTLAACIKKAQLGLERAGVAGEILIADNGSTDGSQEIGTKLGARVVHVPEKGYGNALKGGIAAASGKWIIMGDADDSYDFSEITGFVKKLGEGNDLVMGCRLLRGGGKVLPGAMPFSHRWFGNPMFTLMARHMFSSRIHDVYCGLRAFTKEHYERLDLRCVGMEFATEMLIKSSINGAKIAEVPITLHPDGRKAHAPHLKTFRDGWRTLRFFMIFSPRWLFLYPGILLVLLGLIGFALAMPNVPLGGITFDAHTLLFSSLAILLGYQSILFAILAKTFAVNEGLLPEDEKFNRFFKVMYLERGLMLGAASFFAGIVLLACAVGQWWHVHFGHLDYAHTMRWVIPGFTLTALGFQTCLSSFFVSILGMKRR